MEDIKYTAVAAQLRIRCYQIKLLEASVSSRLLGIFIIHAVEWSTIYV